jgi:hypothetical protein
MRCALYLRHLAPFALALVALVTVLSLSPLPSRASPIRGQAISLSPSDSISDALRRAQPGDTIQLADGLYKQDVVTDHAGQPGAPITLIGSRRAIITGAGEARIIQIFHPYITLDGFTVDGTAGGSQRDKGIYVLGQRARTPMRGVRLVNLHVRNIGGECVRLRYYIQGAEIANNQIGPCGLEDFPGGKWGGSGKNGEGAYIGTAPEQRGDGKSPDASPDQSDGNWVHNNTFNTQGNECVDIKEDASGNLVENNTCTGQRDPESAGFDSRGDANIFRANTSTGNTGAGFRLGGDLASQGIGNFVYDNQIGDNAQGGVKVQRSPQGAICGNHGQTTASGTFGSLFQPAGACDPARLPKITGPDLIGSPGAPLPTPPVDETVPPVPTTPPTRTPRATPPPATPQPTTTPPDGEPGALVYRIHDRVPQRIEAERSTSLAGLLHVAQQGSRTVLVSDGAGMLRPIPTDGARYALDVDDGLSGQFYVWVFGRGPDGDQNSVWLRATGGEPVAVQLEDDDEWGWKRASKPIRLDEGLSYLTLMPRERGTAIDQLVITNDPNYRPSSGRATSDALGQARALVSPEPFAEPQSLFLPLVTRP